MTLAGRRHSGLSIIRAAAAPFWSGPLGSPRAGTWISVLSPHPFLIYHGTLHSDMTLQALTASREFLPLHGAGKSSDTEGEEEKRS